MSDRPSLESLVEKEDIGTDVFHPGGLEMTDKLCSTIGLKKGDKILEIGSGSGATACFAAKHYGCSVVGIDRSEYLVARAKEKAESQQLDVEFILGDAQHLPFEKETFDAVIAECVLTLLDKEQVLKEIHRVLKDGGTLGIHDICWKETASNELKERLYQLEEEKTETINGWRELFSRQSFSEVEVIELPHLMKEWFYEMKKKLGIIGQLRIFLKAFRKWGISGLLKIKQTEDVFQDEALSYMMIKAKKLSSDIKTGES